MISLLGYWITTKYINITQKVKASNEKFAAFCTRMFGSMGMFYVFLMWSILPILPAIAPYKDFILYVSSGVIQLAALPLLMVGGIVLNRASEKRAEEDHITLLKEFAETKHLHTEIKKIVHEINESHEEIHKILTTINGGK